ncbi:MAG: hypothetical protein SF339_05175 [Blastocatellia bacterium]|nr:hypothetical protein [Blastocatellia bacterium]
MKKQRDPINEAAAWQAARTLQASPAFDALSAEKQDELRARLSAAYVAAFANQPNFDAEEALQTLQDDGLAADYLNELNFPKFVRDLLKGTFDAIVDASIRQMEAYAELLKAASASVSQFAREVSDKEARAWLESKTGAGDPPRAAALRAARLALAREQRRLLREVILIGIARFAARPRTSPGKAFLGIRPSRDQFNPKLREKIFRELHGAPKTAAPATRGMMRTRDAAAPAPAPVGELSGKQWVARFPASREIDTLEPAFRANVARFLEALKQARVAIRISSTLRPPERAYLMHWSWKIVRGVVTGETIPPRPGVDIVWWHGNPEATRQAAREMVDGYGIGGLGVAPALASRHLEGKAIDMSLSWSGPLTIKRADGSPVTIASLPADGTNAQLIEVGKTYNVIHFINVMKDKPHWSTDGR